MNRYCWLLINLRFIPTVKPTRCTSFSNSLFLHNNLHVSDGLSAHHQEFRIVHTVTVICQTDTATCLLAGTRWNCSCAKINNLRNWCIWFGFTVGIYYDERTYERQILRFIILNFSTCVLLAEHLVL
jgi:hypothetical protein